MHRKLGFMAGLLLVTSLVTVAPPAAAQNIAGVSGIVTDYNGKPMPDMIVLIKSRDTGMVLTLKTDKNGKYQQIGMRPGIYVITLKAKDKEQAIVEGMPCQVLLDPDNHCDIPLKNMIAKETAEQEAARQKAEEDAKKFQDMKALFMSGQNKLDEADKARAGMMKAPADQRSALQPKVNGMYQDALQDFTHAQQAAPQKDVNLPLVYYKMGYVNEMMNNYPAAVEDYQKASDLKPASSDFLNDLATAYAKAGKTPEALKACDKATTVDPAGSAGCWMNVGVVLYNTNHLPEAVEPLKKATSINPNGADGWYLLGASLLATMQTRQEGEKITYIVTPGTAEAYQKYLALAPTGRFAAEAQGALQALESLGAGVDTKIKVKGKKP